MKHQIAVRSFGDEFKWVAPDDLEIAEGITLGKYKSSVAGEISALKRTCDIQTGEIAKLRGDIEAVKLQNIEIVKGLISR